MSARTVLWFTIDGHASHLDPEIGGGSLSWGNTSLDCRAITFGIRVYSEQFVSRFPDLAQSPHHHADEERSTSRVYC
jgi:hypothetical protein